MSALMKLNNWYIEELISKYKGLTIKITNPKAYMQTMIYNIAFENDDPSPCSSTWYEHWLPIKGNG